MMSPRTPLLLGKATGLRSTPRRAALSVLAIALPVALLAAVRTVSEAARTAHHAASAALLGRADLRIVGDALGFPAAVLELVEADPGVASAAPIVEGHLAVAGAHGEALELFGVDLLNLQGPLSDGTTGRVLGQDPLVAIASPDSVFVTRAFADRRGLRPSSGLRVATPRGEAALVVRGFLEPRGRALAVGSRLAIMDLPAAQHLLGRGNRLDAIDVILHRRDDAARARASLARRLPAGLRVVDPAARPGHVEAMRRSLEATLSLVCGLAFAAAAMMLDGALMSTIARRRAEIATLRAVGMSRRQLVASLAADAVALGLVAGLLGYLLGWVLATGVARQMARTGTTILAVPFVVARPALTPHVLLLAALAGGLAAGCAAVRPIWMHARLSPTARRDDPGASGRARPWRRRWLPLALVAWIGAVVLAAALDGADGAWPTRIVALGLLVAGTVASRGALTVAARASAYGAVRLRAALVWLASLAVREGPGAVVCPVGCLTLGITLVISVAAVHRSLREGILQVLTSQVRGDLVVSSSSDGGGWLPAPLDDGVAGVIERLPGVARVMTLRVRRHEYEGTPITLRVVGGAPVGARYGRPVTITALDDWARRFNHGRGVVVSASFARAWGIRPGARLTLTTPAGPRAFTVVAVAIDYVSGTGTVTLPRALYRAFWDDRLINFAEVFVARKADPEAVALAIEHALGGRHPLRLRATADYVQHALGTFDRALGFTRGLELIVLLVALVAIVDGMLVMIAGQRRELAVLRAIGATRSQTRRLVVYEACLIGLAGGVLGCLTGAAIASAWVTIALEQMMGYVVAFSFPADVLVPTLAAALGVSALGGLVAAGQAAPSRAPSLTMVAP